MKYINPKINVDNLNDYFKHIKIVGDGNCGVYAIIYNLKYDSSLNTYDGFEDLYNGNGELYYDEDAKKQFRTHMSQIYAEQKKLLTDQTTIKRYEQRVTTIQRDKEWLVDTDIALFGEANDLCIGVFEHLPKFRFTVVSNIDNGVSLDQCTNNIFLYNTGYTEGNHFDVLSPLPDAEIYRDLTKDEIIQYQGASDSSPKQITTNLFYKQKDIVNLNTFIRLLNNQLNIRLDEKISFYTEHPEKIDKQIVLEPEQIKEKKIPEKSKPKPEAKIHFVPFTDVDNELLKDFPLYTPNTIQINMKRFYLNDQYGFYDTIHELLDDLYKETEQDNGSCDKSTSEFVMLRHQKIVQTYLNSYTPYRGLLLYHGLGSGKTCSSISILEGMKHDKKIYIMTPASLQQNYRTQLQFCGDKIFKTKNKWTKMDVNENYDSIIQLFKDYLHLDKDKEELVKYIEQHKCVWLIHEGGNSYNDLSQEDKSQVNQLIRLLISVKYRFINYNGVNKKKWETIKQNKNPFHNSVVIIDEAHNFIGKIYNKLSVDKPSVSRDMYEYLMDAQNCKIILLSGTPYINSPAELGVMINLISGYTTQYEFKLNGKYDKKQLRKQLEPIEKYNVIDYKLNEIHISRNPYGFITTPSGEIEYEKSSSYAEANSNKAFETKIKTLLNNVSGELSTNKYKKMPETEKDFNNLFVKQEGTIKLIHNKDFFQTRIAGLISYLGDKTSLMPRLLDIVVENIPMSSHQRKQYDIYKQKESTKKGDAKSEGSYKVFTRAACNFVFDEKIPRPFPTMSIKTEKDFDYANKEERIQDAHGIEEDGDLIVEDTTYDNNIKRFISQIVNNRQNYFYNELKKVAIFEQTDVEDGLQKYSPKFHKILENILNNLNKCQLLYSGFRRIEGIEMMSLMLKYQGFKQLEIKKLGNRFKIELHGLPGYTYNKLHVFTLYTGTEEKEVKEYIRNIYNSDFNKLPSYMIDELKTLYNLDELDNIRGDIINLLMITASGAEGIDLQNTRMVHITEPYWHYVRIEQVIGRARRICSHSRLPKEEQDVQVYIYISELKDDNKMISTDEFLYKIMNEKHMLSESFLNTLKESAIDCVSPNKCFKFPNKEKRNRVYELDYKKEPQQKKKRNKDFMNYYIEVYGKKIPILYNEKKPNEAYIQKDKKLNSFNVINKKIIYNGKPYKMNKNKLL